jgi:hypothetical protein
MALKTAPHLAGLLAALLVSGTATAQLPEGTPDPRPPAEPPPARAEEPGPGAPRRPPATLPYYEWAPIPHGYSLRMSGGRMALVVAGVATFATMHLASFALGIGLAASGCDRCGRHGGMLMIPVAGPFVAFSQQGTDDPRGLYPVLGAFQIIGLGMLMTGMTLNGRRLVREDKAFPVVSRSDRDAGGVALSFTPILAPGHAAASAGISF